MQVMLSHVGYAYPGALLVVSHDPFLVEACTSRIWKIADGAVREA